MSGYEIAYLAIEAVFFSGWIIKQFISPQYPNKSDPYTEDRYMIGLVEIRTLRHLLNATSLKNILIYGGRIVTGGGKIWFIYNDKFQRGDINKPSIMLSKFKMIDTGIKVNDAINKRLDSMIGQEFNWLFNNCSNLDVEADPGWLIIKRQIIETKTSRLRAVFLLGEKWKAKFRAFVQNSIAKR